MVASCVNQVEVTKSNSSNEQPKDSNVIKCVAKKKTRLKKKVKEKQANESFEIHFLLELKDDSIYLNYRNKSTFVTELHLQLNDHFSLPGTTKRYQYVKLTSGHDPNYYRGQYTATILDTLTNETHQILRFGGGTIEVKNK